MENDIQVPVDIPELYVTNKKAPELKYYMEKKRHQEELQRDNSIIFYPADKMIPKNMTKKMSMQMSSKKMASTKALSKKASSKKVSSKKVSSKKVSSKKTVSKKLSKSSRMWSKKRFSGKISNMINARRMLKSLKKK
jgi:hypothetical protein